MHPRSRRTGRLAGALATAVAGTVAAATALVAVPASAEAATPADDAAAGWLARQLVDGDHLEVDFGGGSVFPDYGLTVDALFALAAAGVGGDAAAAVVDYLDDDAVAYTGFGDPAEQYAGATAKLALGALVAGADPTNFGGLDLIAQLEGLEAPSGRFSDASAFGDFSNTIGQSLAIVALERQGAGASSTSVAFLAGLQCADGGFPLAMDGGPCTGDVDSTAFVLQALAAAGSSTGAVADFLEAEQNVDGSFDGAIPGSANSTGLAAQALAVAGRSAAASEAVAFLADLQVGCDAGAATRGAIPADASGFVQSSAERATAQAVAGLAGIGFVDLSTSGAASAAPQLDCTPPPEPSTTTTMAPTTTSLPSGPAVPPTAPTGPAISSLPSALVAAGSKVIIDEPGFGAGDTVRIVLYSEPVVLATTTASADGRVQASVTVPPGAAAGSHTLAIISSTLTKASPITVTAAGTASTAALARTGDGDGPLTAIGLVAIGGGIALVQLARRRRERLGS